VLLCAAPSLLTAHLAVAQEEPTQPAQVRTFPRFSKVQPAKPEPKEDPQAPQPEIRLLYLNAEWTTVLRDVAKDAGYELTLHDVPRGKYTRRDIKKHPAPEAIRILNQELEPQGYRILVTGRHMTVIGIQRSRVEYPRREIPTAGSVANQAQAPAVPGIQQAAATELPGVAPQLQAVDSRTAAAPINPARNQHPAGQVIPAGHQDQGTRSIQRAQFEQPALLGDQPQPAQQTTPPAVAEKLVTRKIVPMQRTAADLARQIHRAFERRAVIIDKGPQGFPAIRVGAAAATQPLLGDEPAPAATPGPSFTLELDTAGNTLWLEATEATVASLERLILLLDKQPAAPDETERLIPGGDTLTEAAERLQPELQRLQTMRRRELAQGMPQPLNADEGMNNLNLRGDVTLEAMQDLDLIILRGNAADVEKVMEMIQRIEQMAVGTTPSIHILQLANVNSESLAELLADVYERMTNLQPRGSAQARKQVDIVPVVRPNSIIIIAPDSVMESILELARNLDQPIDPTFEVQVFRLQNAVASQVETAIEDFFEGRAGLGKRVKVTADIRTNSLIVQARPGELAEVKLIISKMDKDDAKAVNQMKMIPLRHAAADELATFLSTAIQSVLNPAQQQTGFGGGGFAGGQAAQQLRDSKAVVLEFLGNGQNAERLLRSGLLTDIRFNGDVRTNTLIITAPKQSLPLLEELVRMLDQPSAAVAEIKLFQIRNADAQSIVDLLTQLFSNQTQQGQGQQNQQLGIQIAGAQDSSSSLVPLRFQADVRTNSVLAVGGADALRMVEAVVLRLDQPDSLNRQKTVYKLRNSSAQNVAQSITTFLQSERNLLTIDPNRVSTSQLLEQEVIVTPETITNSLLISATPKYFDTIMRLTRQLDAEPAQVMIQALLVEVQLTDNDEFGVELGFQDDILFDRGIVDSIQTITQTTTNPNGQQTTNQVELSRTLNPGFPFNNLPLGNNATANPNTIGSQGLSNFGVGRVSSDLGFGGLVLSASSENVSVLIRALASRRNVRVLSRPQIMALDNQTAQIQVGESVPILGGITQTAGIANTSILYRDTGIILTVAPRISPEGQVVMEVTAEKSAVGAGLSFVTNSAAGETAVQNSPSFIVTTATTSIKVPDGQTVVVGGMITESTQRIERKVPWLGDLPIVGSAFRYDSQSHDRRELLIFLTPRIIRCEEDFEFLKQVEAGRIRFFHDEAEAIHGPLFGLPQPQFGYGADIVVPEVEQQLWDQQAPAPFVPPSY
jgi:type II secretion system protein D